MLDGEGFIRRPAGLLSAGDGGYFCPVFLLPDVYGRSESPAGLLSAVYWRSASPAGLLSAVDERYFLAALFYLPAVCDADAVVVLHEAGEASAEVLVVFLLGAAPLYFAHGAEPGQ